MSLVSLTFGKEKTGGVPVVSNQSESQIQVTTPADLIAVNPTIENRLEIKKSCQFLGHSDVYVVGQIVSGVVSHKMKGKVNNQSFDIVDLECKYGHRIAKEGMTVGLTVRGLTKDSFVPGQVISFSQ